MSEDLFTIANYKIQYEHLGEPIYLIPFGDIHWGSKSCATELFKEFCDWARKKKNCYFIGTGDYIDLASYSERIILGNPKIHSTTVETIDDLYKRQAYDFCEQISFMKNRIIGMIEGNHYGRLQSGVSSTQLICQRLNCKYLGGSSFIKLSFSQGEKKNRTRNAISMWVHHGSTATKRIGGSVLTVENMRFNANADIFLCAHDHRKWVATATTLELCTTGKIPKLHHKKILMARTGSFQKAYEANTCSYAARRQLSPADLGVVKLELTPKVVTRPYIDDFGKERLERVTYVDLHGSV